MEGGSKNSSQLTGGSHQPLWPGAARNSLRSGSLQPQEIRHSSRNNTNNNNNNNNNNSSKFKNRNTAAGGDRDPVTASQLDALKSSGQSSAEEKTTCRPPVKKVKRTGSARRLAAAAAGGGALRAAKKGPPCCGSPKGGPAGASQLKGSEPTAEKYRSITEFESRSWLFLCEKESAAINTAAATRGQQRHFCADHM